MAVRTVSRLLALASLALLFGCGPTDPTACGTRHRDVELALRQQRARWNALGATTYEYTFERLCFCPEDIRGPFRVRVENGAIVRTQPAVPASFPEAVATIPQAFDIIDEAVDRGACSIDVRYDAATGVPADVFIDYDQRLADEEMGFRISDVAILR